MSARTALITGGTSGIGKATAEVLRSRGYRVAVTGQRPESVARAQAELPEDVLVFQADGRSLADKVVSEVGARFGSLTTLFLNAGVSRPMTLDTADEAAFDGALLAMIPTLALELAPRRIRVNAVSPGFTDTPMTRTSLRARSKNVAATMAAMANTNPFGRLGVPEDIARTVAFLASDDAAYVTGQEIMVSGGAGLAI